MKFSKGRFQESYLYLIPLKLHSEQPDTKGSFHVHKDTTRKGPNRECKCFLYFYNNIHRHVLKNNYSTMRNKQFSVQSEYYVGYMWLTNMTVGT